MHWFNFIYMYILYINTFRLNVLLFTLYSTLVNLVLFLNVLIKKFD